jgi:hypothetical protein
MWDSGYTICSFMCIFCRSLPVLLSSLCCLSFFDDFRIRITLWYFQPLLTIHIQEEFTATFTDIALYPCPRQKRDIKHISHFEMFKERCVYVNENKQRYNKKILYYNTI